MTGLTVGSTLVTGARAAPVYPLLHKVIRTNSTSVGHTIQEQKRLESRLPLTRSILFPTSILTMFSLVAYVESSFSHTLRPSKVERQEQSYAGGHRKRHANVTQTHTQSRAKLQQCNTAYETRARRSSITSRSFSRGS